MRVGRAIIDTDNMTTDELSTLIQDLRAIRKRKLEAESLLERFTGLIEEAKSLNFNFFDKHFGNVLDVEDYVLYDLEKDHHYNV